MLSYIEYVKIMILIAIKSLIYKTKLCNKAHTGASTIKAARTSGMGVHLIPLARLPSSASSPLAYSSLSSQYSPYTTLAGVTKKDLLWSARRSPSTIGIPDVRCILPQQELFVTGPRGKKYALLPCRKALGTQSMTDLNLRAHALGATLHSVAGLGHIWCMGLLAK